MKISLPSWTCWWWACPENSNIPRILSLWGKPTFGSTWLVPDMFCAQNKSPIYFPPLPLYFFFNSLFRVPCSTGIKIFPWFSILADSYSYTSQIFSCSSRWFSLLINILSTLNSLCHLELVGGEHALKTAIFQEYYLCDENIFAILTLLVVSVPWKQQYSKNIISVMNIIPLS